MPSPPPSTILVFTANSNTGNAVVSSLLENPGYDKKNTRIRCVIRSERHREDLEDFEDQVEVVIGDIKKEKANKPVFHGVKAAYFAVPLTQDRADLSRRFIDQCMSFGVEYAVLISVVGADEKATLLHQQFAEIEEYAMSMAGKPVHVEVRNTGKLTFKPVVVRSAPFFQNIYGSLGAIKAGTLYLPLDDGFMAHVSLYDVSNVIAHILLDPAKHTDGSGSTYNCIAQYDEGTKLASYITMGSNVRMCKYETVPDEIAVEAFGAHMQPWIAEANVEMLAWYRGGQGQGVHSCIEEITGSPPMSFVKFVKEFLRDLLVD